MSHDRKLLPVLIGVILVMPLATSVSAQPARNRLQVLGDAFRTFLSPEPVTGSIQVASHFLTAMQAQRHQRALQREATSVTHPPLRQSEPTVYRTIQMRAPQRVLSPPEARVQRRRVAQRPSARPRRVARRLRTVARR